MYKYEIHLHSSNCSRCAMSDTREMLDAAKQNGYAGVVLTQHFYGGNTCIARVLDWQTFVGSYIKDFEDAKRYGEEIGIDVIFGLEEGFGEGKEALIYGIEPERFLECEALRGASIEFLSKFVRDNGGIIAVAHPFRHRDYIKNADKEPNAALFDAVETYNHFNTDEENKRADDFAKRHSLLQLSGGDIHAASNFGVAGLLFDVRVKDTKQLADLIKNKKYKLFQNGKIVKPR